MQINADALLYVLPLGFQCGNFVSLNDMYSSLQIFDNESHASIHSDRTKEGLSLYGKRIIGFYPALTYCSISGILNNTKTPLGRSLLRTWLSRPSLSIPVITARHDAVATFLRPENLVTANAIHNHLKGIKNVPRILGSLRSGKARISDWQGIVKVGPFIYSLL